jgi:predicted acetyltransferase
MATRTARSVASLPLSSSPTATSPTATCSTGAASPPPESKALDARRLRLAAARTGDHPSIHAFLLSVFHGPTADEFHAQLEEPGYQPANRLMVKSGEQIAAHLRLARQTIQVCGRALTAARFMDLATAPEFRSRGVASALVAAGQRAAAERGVLVALTRTRAPALFARQGWSVCGRHTFSTASPRSVLAELAARKKDAAVQPFFPIMREEPLIVRPMRRVELAAVVRLYEERSRQVAGWPVRGEAYWEWLLARGACDRMYVASQGAEPPNMAALLESIVGYACVRQSRIVELVTAEKHAKAGPELLERICADAREDDGWTIRYDASAGDPLHATLCAAGGELIDSEEAGGELFMAKVLDPLAVLRKLGPVLAGRAQAAGCHLPCELGLELRAAGGVVERYILKLGISNSTVETGGPSRQCVTLLANDLAPLLLGYRGAEELKACGRLKPINAKAAALAGALFPSNLWSRPVLDDLLA